MSTAASNMAGNPGATPDYAFLLDALKRLADDPRFADAVAEREPAKWLRIPEVVRIYGISRSQLYQLICSGKIRSCSLRKSTQTRGSRRVLAASLDAYFERNATGGSAE